MAAQKVLTVSIAAYNVEDYLGDALESCLIANKDLLDVIVVDDGSTDGTARIAQHYVDAYPNVFRLVSKANGGYGTTVNTSLELAQGTYFRLLDGDDWFYKRGLQQLVNDLAKHDCDMAITPFVEVQGSNQYINDQTAAGKNGLMPFTDDIVFRELSMHSVTYKTSIVRQSGLELPERRPYTDTLFVVTPLPYVPSVFVSHAPVYMYRLGREGQSVSLESEIRNYPFKMQLVQELIALFEGMKEGTAARRIAGYWLSANASFLIWLLYRLPPTEQAKDDINRFVSMIQASPDAWNTCQNQSKWFRLFTSPVGSCYPLAHQIALHTTW